MPLWNPFLIFFLFQQFKIVDFVIWFLFSREKTSNPIPKHMLCDGFRKAAGDGHCEQTAIAGVFSRFPNPHVQTLKEAPWPHLLALLGQSGEKMMIDLLLDNAIFVAVEAGFGNYYQLSGKFARKEMKKLDQPTHESRRTSVRS